MSRTVIQDIFGKPQYQNHKGLMCKNVFLYISPDSLDLGLHFDQFAFCGIARCLSHSCARFRILVKSKLCPRQHGKFIAQAPLSKEMEIVQIFVRKRRLFASNRQNMTLYRPRLGSKARGMAGKDGIST